MIANIMENFNLEHQLTVIVIMSQWNNMIIFFIGFIYEIPKSCAKSPSCAVFVQSTMENIRFSNMRENKTHQIIISEKMEAGTCLLVDDKMTD